MVRNGTLVRRRTSPARAGHVHTGSTTRSLVRTRSRARTTAASTPSYRSATRFTLSRPDRHLEGPRQDTDAGCLGDGACHSAPARASSCTASAARRISASARVDTTTPFPGGTPVGFGWIFGAQLVDVEDQEDWAKHRRRVRDRQWRLDRPQVRRALQQAPARLAQRHRPGADCRPACPPRTIRRRSRTTHPTSTPSADRFPTNVWYWSPSQLTTTTVPDSCNRDPVQRDRLVGLVRGQGKELRGLRAGELQRFELERQLGLRFVRTEEDIVSSRLRQRRGPGRNHELGVRCIQAIARRSHVRRLAAEREPEVEFD